MQTVRIFLTLFNTPSDLLILLATVATCSFNYKTSLIITPRNLIYITVSIPHIAAADAAPFY